MDPDDTPRVLIQNNNGKYAIETVKNSAELDLTIGPRYTQSDVRLNAAKPLGLNTSGVLGKQKPKNLAQNRPKCLYFVFSFILRRLSVLGINDGTRIVQRLGDGPSIQTFHVTGKFGKAYENNFKGSLLSSRASYKHIFPGKLFALCASMQSLYQRRMFDLMGVDIQSQAAYELACKGPIRPMVKNSPLIYGIRCIEYKLPRFTLEIHAMNASEQYLCDLICEIGKKLRSVAHCRQLRCTRYGYFTFEDSLLRANWRPQDILENMMVCRKIIRQNPSMLADEVSTPVGDLNERK